MYCGIVIDEDSNIYTVRNVTSTSAPYGSYDFTINKFTNSGDSIWARTYGTVNYDRINYVAYQNGRIALTGNVNLGGGNDGLIMILDTAGTIISSTLHGDTVKNEALQHVSNAANGEFLFSGTGRICKSTSVGYTGCTLDTIIFQSQSSLFHFGPGEPFKNHFAQITSVSGILYHNDSIVKTQYCWSPAPCAPKNTSLADTICDGNTYSFGGQTISVAGTYYDTLQTGNLCDSIVTLDLVVLDTSANVLNLSDCDSVVVNSQSYHSSGSYIQMLSNSVGCDSILTINVSITDHDTAVVLAGPKLTADSADSYQWINCSDSSNIAGETGQQFTPTITGNYAVILSSNGCADTSSCQNVIVTGLPKQFFPQAKLFPNPTAGLFTIELGAVADFDVQVYDIIGNLLSEKSFTNVRIAELQLSGPAGLKIVKITAKDLVQTYQILLEPQN